MSHQSLGKGGFLPGDGGGSHKIFKNDEGTRITIPYHSGKILHPKILKSILKDADLTADEFIDLMR